MLNRTIEILERIAETGHAPRDGCSRFGVGHELAFDQIREVYLEERFGRGGSSEKFVVGPFGSGKTHFLRHLMEMSRGLGCVTSEVALNKSVDFTQPLIVYREVVRELRAPNSQTSGIRTLLEAWLDQARLQIPAGSENPGLLLERRVSALDEAEFKDPTYGRVLKRALEALLRQEVENVEAYCDWLQGTVSDRALAKKVGVPTISRGEQGRFGACALLSLCQIVRKGGFRGTVICFDEAEQGFSVSKTQFNTILSILQSSINATSDLEGGSALIVYAVTPEIIDGMEKLPALQQRIADPAAGEGFLDGNPYAAKIDLARRGDPLEELKEIGRRLVDLLYSSIDSEALPSKTKAHAIVDAIAADVAESEAAVSNRRTLAKRVAARLLQLRRGGNGSAKEQSSPSEPEV